MGECGCIAQGIGGRDDHNPPYTYMKSKNKEKIKY